MSWIADVISTPKTPAAGQDLTQQQCGVGNPHHSATNQDLLLVKDLLLSLNPYLRVWCMADNQPSRKLHATANKGPTALQAP
jgi:hypothetical protein